MYFQIAMNIIIYNEEIKQNFVANCKLIINTGPDLGPGE